MTGISLPSEKTPKTFQHPRNRGRTAARLCKKQIADRIVFYRRVPLPYENAVPRASFRLFFAKVLGDRPKPKIVASGGRDEAYRDFCRSLKNDPDAFPVLLVDSEDPVPAGKNARAHLQDRETHWTIAIPDGQAYLMVQCMEAWFLADIAAVEEYFGQGFQASALPRNPNIEQVSKVDVLNGLRNATRATGKGPYHKTKHGFDILERIDPGSVRRRSGYADALFEFRLAKLN